MTFRLRTLQVIMALLGAAIVFLGYVTVMSLLHPLQNDISPGDQMLLGAYFPLGVLLLLAVRNPSAHRSLIAFAGWSMMTHMAVMMVQSFHAKNLHGDLPAELAISAIGVALLLLLPRKAAGKQPALASQAEAGTS